MIDSVPKVAVLLASYNGEKWIEEQIESILSQKNVALNLFIYDDLSTDKTIEIITSKYKNNIILLPNLKNRLGSAAKNFFYLIKNTELKDYNYVALSDQDDIWMDCKIINGIKKMNSDSFDFYSSNVLAFWPGGFKKIIKKSQRKKKYDHFFQSPGPGCTFIIKNNSFSNLKKFVKNNYTNLNYIFAHDWLIYAFAINNNFKWIIDSNNYIKYRQHSDNSLGANFGIKSYLKRAYAIYNGNYRNEIINITSITNCKSSIIDALIGLNFFDRIYLFFNSINFRRNLLEAIFLSFFFLIMKKKINKYNYDNILND